MWSHVFILLGLYDVMRQYVVTRFYLTWAVRCHEAVCGHTFLLSNVCSVRKLANLIPLLMVYCLL